MSSMLSGCFAFGVNFYVVFEGVVVRLLIRDVRLRNFWQGYRGGADVELSGDDVCDEACAEFLEK